ncbi:PIH1 domain-containing protein 1-like [Eurytemora carolleeae]|uniref:PIH1 domain-containing protein 1-like n=1 Tax=Eurytemora carolleeae TaxID=1294199 RepID=UPI000C75E2B1|nr:PIH1 domain-containing protein 1-like [Eurytemora carolleeae]|eukprot:XP_023335054.1 PIH1 domain-containing protein 1-like [Eurytemora affinis]
MPGNFQPARLDVDPSILDSKLSFVTDDNEMESMFKQISTSSKPKISSLIPEEEYPSSIAYPKPGLCMKTRNADGKKFFINLCVLQEIPPPTPISEQELERVIADEDYSTLWRVPMSIGAPREIKDKSGVECLAADVAINSTWFQETLVPSLIFTTFVLTVAMEGLCDKHGETARLERDGWTILKNKKYMGSEVPPHRIQKRASAGISDLNTKTEVAATKEVEEVKRVSVTKTQVPQYKIEKNSIENPEELTATVFLPGIKHIRHISLDIGEDRLILEVRQSNILLDIFLPYNLNPDASTAVFNPSSSLLILSLPILI